VPPSGPHREPLLYLGEVKVLLSSTALQLPCRTCEGFRGTHKSKRVDVSYTPKLKPPPIRKMPVPNSALHAEAK